MYKKALDGTLTVSHLMAFLETVQDKSLPVYIEGFGDSGEAEYVHLLPENKYWPAHILITRL